MQAGIADGLPASTSTWAAPFPTSPTGGVLPPTGRAHRRRPHPRRRRAARVGVTVAAARGTSEAPRRHGPTLQLNGPLGADGPVRVALGFDVAPPPGPPPAPGDRPWGPVGTPTGSGRARGSSSTVVHDGTAGLARTGVVVLYGAARGRRDRRGGAAAPASTGASSPWPRRSGTAAVNVLPVVQRARVAPAVFPAPVPACPTRRSSRHRRSRRPAVRPRVRPGDRGRRGRWPAADFVRSGPDDPHYVVLDDRVLFGNGVNGRSPADGAQHPAHTGLARTRGTAGNVRPRPVVGGAGLGPRPYGPTARPCRRRRRTPAATNSPAPHGRSPPAVRPC